MEKYSAYRPFLNPVPPNVPTLPAKLLLPFGYLIGAIRTILILLVGLLYLFLVEIILKAFHPVAPLRRSLAWIFTAILARLALLLLGLWWIPTTHVTRKRGRAASVKVVWAPKAGDIIVSNWVSWVEILWLAFRFNPIFAIPVTAQVEKHHPRVSPNTPGRRTGTGSAAISSPALRPPTVRVPVIGFRTVSLLHILRLTGHVPPYSGLSSKVESLDRIREGASHPIVIFPECTTSNGRAMLRLADVFGESSVPVKGFQVYIMCVRYDPPTLYKPTLACSIPSSSIFHPLPHVFQVATSLSPSFSRSLSIRLLNPAESPSSGSFLRSDVLGGGVYKDELAEACAVLISQLGKIRITGQAWEDKVAFLEFYHGKRGK
ncbi:hypothetical protein K439DRAFT_1643672 [Ramaria rubella]|nr:hypothetical protein K439DRAFT_1643672 [Ramaria rubella]